ncbi:MAG: hypothetical protein ACOY3K_01415 [Candidatus Omnitrophota bacterium]
MVDLGKVYADLSPIGRILLIIAAICVFIALMDLIVLGPIVSRLQVLDAEIAAKQETARRNLRILSFEDRIMEEYHMYSDYLDSGARSREEIIGELLKKIEIFAEQQQVSILNVSPGDVKENPVFQEYTTKLKCEGGLEDVLSFMNMLEESDYLFQITHYKFVPKSKKGDILECEMDIARTLIKAESIPEKPVAA